MNPLFAKQFLFLFTVIVFLFQVLKDAVPVSGHLGAYSFCSLPPIMGTHLEKLLLHMTLRTGSLYYNFMNHTCHWDT